MTALSKIRLFATSLCLMTCFGPAMGNCAETKIAIAANFTAPAKEIASAFERVTGHHVKISFGSTGKLFAQIVNGAPFSAFLAADQARPKRAEEQGFAIEGSRFTYARGQIALYSTDPSLIDPQGAVLMKPEAFSRLAITNPKTAPYGAAAMEVLNNMTVPEQSLDKIVKGDTVIQTYQFIATNNAQLGFVALSQLVGVEEGSRWMVPARLYTPIKQDAILLKSGAKDKAALAFLHFLKGEEARAIIRKFGYDIER
ncbi:molybdate ABC transporter substrate-binding protein [uncultured Cohaesibacter sp.]|uniref:molybdate ABC transporter substrate-binding protein n=1 Tax=uncultured Cohaesibacter sp. TaxID=1002546 RepID=UPI00292E7DF5|nr:molybdate ABC transporter substrate-binding protein [uncultured Cohaesibacter sp.]